MRELATTAATVSRNLVQSFYPSSVPRMKMDFIKNIRGKSQSLKSIWEYAITIIVLGIDIGILKVDLPERIHILDRG